MASQAGLFTIQEFTDSGQLMLGGRVYTYTHGTTVFKTAYTDINGLIPHTYTNDGIGGQYIATDARGEIPAPLYLATGSYDIVLKRSDGSTVWTRRADPTADFVGASTSAITTALADGVTIGNGSALIGWVRGITGNIATTVKQLLKWSDISAFEFMSAAQVADVQAYAYSLDVTVALQAAIDAAWSSGKRLMLPAGGYRVTGLTLAGSSPNEDRILHMEGEGFGNPFTVGSNRGTNIKGTTNAPVFQVTVPAIPITAGTLILRGIVFDGNSSSFPVVYLQSFYGVSEVSRCLVYQRGTGNGMEVPWMTTGEISNCYFLNRDMVASGLGAARVGVGLYLNHQYDSGLQTVRKCSSRGWNKGFKIGQGGSAFYTYSASLENCEASTVYHGIHLTDNARGTLVNNCYLEGGEGGNGLWDEGDYNKITNCFSFSGFAVHLKSDAFTYGNYYSGNLFLAGTAASQTLISITSSSALGGPGKVCTGNHLSFGGSGGVLANVIGLSINGTHPRIDLSGNNFFPRGAWVGGVNTRKIADISAHTAGAGSGVHGLAMVDVGEQEFPWVAQGAFNVGMDTAVLTAANIAGNVLTISKASDFVITCAAAQTVNSFSSPNLEGKLFWIRTTNANTTFANTANLKMAGGANYTPGASGASIQFKVQAGIAWECARVAY